MSVEPDVPKRPPRRVSVQVVEDLIRELPGVIDTKVVVSRWGAIEEVHVVADWTRPSKTIVRDVRSVLAARLGLLLDYRKISVARIRGIPPADKFARLQVVRQKVAVDTILHRIRVELELETAPFVDRLGRTVYDPELPRGPFTGTGEASSLGDGPLRAGALAYVEAANQALRRGFFLEVVAVERGQVAGRPTAQALLLYHQPQEPARFLLGAVLISSEDGVMGGIRAAMDASNRVFGRAVKRLSPHRKLHPDDTTLPSPEPHPGKPLEVEEPPVS
ncbi:MAG: hypothetical protein KM310_01210 [Clostridiales bacterium]|nr:hypothetical protein [Clostridiales bacterium]